LTSCKPVSFSRRTLHHGVRYVRQIYNIVTFPNHLVSKVTPSVSLITVYYKLQQLLNAVTLSCCSNQKLRYNLHKLFFPADGPNGSEQVYGQVCIYGTDSMLHWTVTDSMLHWTVTDSMCLSEEVTSRHSMAAQCKCQGSITGQLMKEDNHLIYIWNCKTNCERII